MDQMLLIDSCDNGSLEINLHESNLDKGLIKFRGKFQEAEAVNKNKRIYPYSVLDENVQRLMEVVKARGLVGQLDHPCLVDDNFEILTLNGWKSFREIRIGDEVFSRVNGKMIASKVEAIIDESYDGPSYRVKGRAIDCEFTAPHKMLLCNRKNKEHYKTVDEVHKNRAKHSHDYIPKTATWQGNKKDKIVVPGVPKAEKQLVVTTEKFVTFLGLYLAEGCLKKAKKSKTNRIEISQKSEYGRKIIKELLSDFHEEITWKEFKDGFYTTDARLYNYLIPLGNKYNKYIPQEIKNLDSKYLEKLVAAFAVGDGRVLQSEDGGKTMYNLKESKEYSLSLDQGNYSRQSVFSVSKKLVDDLHECVIKCGLSGTRTIVVDENDYEYAGRIIKAENKKPLHCLNISRSKGIHLSPKHLKTIEGHHTGSIYCLKTEFGNFYMKYKGKAFWTGNCDSIIHFKEVSHIITKLYWDGQILMGEGEILNTAHGRQLKALLNDGVRVGISSRGVGNGKVNENGILVIGESYKLITFDAVADPSCHQAFQERVVGQKRENVNYNNYSDKNTSNGIHKINKEAVIAALGGIVKSQTGKIKTRLG